MKAYYRKFGKCDCMEHWVGCKNNDTEKIKN